jgi:hypothetical protein
LCTAKIQQYKSYDSPTELSNDFDEWLEAYSMPVAALNLSTIDQIKLLGIKINTTIDINYI